jgi:hypothetical protein
VEFLDQSQGLFVHCLMVAHHFLGEFFHIRLGGVCESLLTGGDIKDAGGIGNMGNLGIVWLLVLRPAQAGQQKEAGKGDFANHENSLGCNLPLDDLDAERFPMIEAP